MSTPRVVSGLLAAEKPILWTNIINETHPLQSQRFKRQIRYSVFLLLKFPQPTKCIRLHKIMITITLFIRKTQYKSVRFKNEINKHMTGLCLQVIFIGSSK
jgi:hypothetical protein